MEASPSLQQSPVGGVGGQTQGSALNSESKGLSRTRTWNTLLSPPPPSTSNEPPPPRRVEEVRGQCSSTWLLQERADSPPGSLSWLYLHQRWDVRPPGILCSCCLCSVPGVQTTCKVPPATPPPPLATAVTAAAGAWSEIYVSISVVAFGVWDDLFPLFFFYLNHHC